MNQTSPIRVGIMGFGQIGRQIYDLASQSDDVQVVAVADIGKPEILHYLLCSEVAQPENHELQGNFLVNPRFRTRLMRIDQPEEMHEFMAWLTDECIRMMREVADFMGPEKVHGHFHFDQGTGYVWDDMVSMCGEDWYMEHVAPHTEKVLQAFGGGGFHTCGPLKPDYFRAIKAMPSVNALNFAFVPFI